MKGEKPNISYEKSYLPSLLKCYRDIQRVNELCEKEKEEIRQPIFNAITNSFRAKRKIENPDSGDITNLLGGALNSLRYCSSHRFTIEEKSAKEQFNDWVKTTYPNLDLQEKNLFKNYVLEDEKSLTEEIDAAFIPNETQFT